MEDCIFCKIADGELESEKIYETENVIAFLDINPKAPGHSLVIPKKHGKTLTELEDELIAEVFRVTKEVERLLNLSIKPDAFTVGINEGEASGQEIPHLHVNIIPRFEDDGGVPIQAVVDNPPKEEISNIASKIRKASEK